MTQFSSPENHLSIAVVLVMLALTMACGRFIPAPAGSTETTNSNANSIANANTVTANPGLKELLDKKHGEFKTLSPPLALDPKARITGKTLVVSTESELDDRKFFSTARQAGSLDELQNIIQINCGRGKFLGDYEWSNTNSKSKGYASDCKVSLIDYKANKVIAQKTFSNSVADDIVTSRNRDGDAILMDMPLRDIITYIQSFPYDAVIPGSYVEERELVGAATKLGIDPSAGLRGKVAIGSLIERGPVDVNAYTLSDYVTTETYGIPADKITRKYEDLDTLVRVICRQGAPIGVNEGSKQFASKCDVQVIDYKTMTVVAQKTIENKTIDTKITKGVSAQWIVDHPKDLIAEYLRSLPIS